MNPVLWSLIGFSVAMYITPGPNNAMVAASAATHGIRATIPHMLGIVTGFATMLVMVCAGLGSLLVANPGLLLAFRWVGAAWLGFLAWKIASAPMPGTGLSRPVMGFAGAAGFQWINPKAWLIGVAAAGEYMSPNAPLAMQLARIGVVFFLVGLPCLIVWAAIGSGAGRLLRAPGRRRVFNVAMGVLLIASVIPVLLEE